MNIGGLGARAALKQKPTNKCDRCGLRYSKDMYSCPHCSDIKSDSELESFKENIENERKAGAHLGVTFLYIALVLIIILFFTMR